MDNVCQIEFLEAVRVDPDRLVELCVSLGDMGAEQLIMVSMDELSVGMNRFCDYYAQSEWNKMVVQAASLERTASHVGMTTLGQVLCDVIECIEHKDSVALAATVERLGRIADRSLCAVWDMRDAGA